MPESAFLSFAPLAATAPLQSEVSAAGSAATDTADTEASSFNNFLQGASQRQRSARTVASETDSAGGTANNLQSADTDTDSNQRKGGVTTFLTEETAEGGDQPQQKGEDTAEPESDLQAGEENASTTSPAGQQIMQCPVPQEREDSAATLSAEREVSRLQGDSGTANLTRQQDISATETGPAAKGSITRQQTKETPFLPAAQTADSLVTRQGLQLTPGNQSEESRGGESGSVKAYLSSQQTESSKISLAFSQPQIQTAQGKGVIAGGWQGNDAIITRLQNIIDAADETGSVSIAITKGTAISQQSVSLKTIEQFHSTGIYPAAEESPLASETTTVNAGLFKILGSGEQNSASRHYTAGSLQPESPAPKEWYASRTLITEPHNQGAQPALAGERTSVTVGSLTTAKEISSNGLQAVPAETEGRIAINGNMEKQTNPASGSSVINSILPMESSAEGALFSSDSGSNGTLFSHTAQSQAVETAAAPAQTITLPSGLTVRENEVVRQFMDKFQINGRNLESRINIKLNPAELGEIEIALAVKEKTIKANVVAQSQITQGILEKNLDRIRTILEKQGFAIGELNIMTSDPAAAEFDLFEREFTRQQQDAFPKRNRSTALSSQQEEAGQEAGKEEGRVNLAV